MEISLEKIELVKDRTGVGYKEAKEALEKTEGSVVDAIIFIEDSIDESSKSRMGEQGAAVIETIKELIQKGNVSKITVKRDGETILNIPLNVGIIGTVIFPWAAVGAIVAAFGTRCAIELIKDDGEVVDVSSKAAKTLDEVVSKGGAVFEDVKDKSGDIFEDIKDKGEDFFDSFKDKGEDFVENVKDKSFDVWGSVKDKAEALRKPKTEGDASFYDFDTENTADVTEDLEKPSEEENN